MRSLDASAIFFSNLALTDKTDTGINSFYLTNTIGSTGLGQLQYFL